MHRMASMGLTAVQVFKMGDKKFSALDIQKTEQKDSGQILSIESIQEALADYYYLGYLADLGKGQYKFDMSGRELQIGALKKKT